MTQPGLKPRYAAIIPAYQEWGRIGEVVRAARRHCALVIVVDDGSTDGTGDEARAAGAVVIRHEVNRGKGVALNTGFQAAREHGCEAVITLDADGQHDPNEIPKFIEAYERTGIPVLVGNRMTDPKTMPWVRRWTNRYMSWLLSRLMGQFVPDSQCGYRLYRLDILPFVSAQAERFAAESEILLHIAERNIRMDSVRIRTIYKQQPSKISPFRDTVRFFRMLRQYRRARKRS